jgi:hypothetical protein
MKPSKPKILIWDIETSHDVLASYGLREQFHSPENILQDWYMICAKWKWHGSKRIYGVSILDDMKRFKKDCADDYVVIKHLHELMTDVDFIVGHNVYKFDWKMFYTRVMFHRLPPLPMPQFIDTLAEVKKLSRHSSASLKHLARYYNLTPKIEHSRGMGMKILRGDIAATKECFDYCGGDIVSTEELYDLISPHMVNSIVNHNLWRLDGAECCPNCGSTDIKFNGFRYSRAGGKYRHAQCLCCGKWSKHFKRVQGSKIQ